jgi:hypothetical protein
MLMVTMLAPKRGVVCDPLSLHGRSQTEVTAMNGAPDRTARQLWEWWVEADEATVSPRRSILRVWFGASGTVVYSEVLAGV